jgi:hypothetical protein
MPELLQVSSIKQMRVGKINALAPSTDQSRGSDQSASWSARWKLENPAFSHKSPRFDGWVGSQNTLRRLPSSNIQIHGPRRRAVPRPMPIHLGCIRLGNHVLGGGGLRQIDCVGGSRSRLGTALESETVAAQLGHRLDKMPIT